MGDAVGAMPVRLIERLSAWREPGRFLIVGEGMTEVAFVRGLCGCLGIAEGGCVRAAKGGSGAKVVEVAAKAVADAGKAGKAFVEGRRLVLLDADRGTLPGLAQRRAAKFGLELLWSEPCLEAEVLRWLRMAVPGGSGAAKGLFEKRVLDARAKQEAVRWERLIRERLEGLPPPAGG